MQFVVNLPSPNFLSNLSVETTPLLTSTAPSGVGIVLPPTTMDLGYFSFGWFGVSVALNFRASDKQALRWRVEALSLGSTRPWSIHVWMSCQSTRISSLRDKTRRREAIS
jgi:hypothetical protein